MDHLIRLSDALAALPGGNWCDPQQVADALRELPAAPEITPEFAEHLAAGWDECMFDGPGETIDIGASIRRAVNRWLAGYRTELINGLTEAETSATASVAGPTMSTNTPAELAAPRWPFRVEYVQPHGYVVWRDVFEGQMRCNLRDAVLAHRQATFVCEQDAADYCEYRNDATIRHGTDDVELIRAARKTAALAQPAQAAGTPAGQIETVAHVMGLVERMCDAWAQGDASDVGRATEAVEEAVTALATPQPAPAEPADDEGPKCRDCADFGPICPSSGRPCGEVERPAYNWKASTKPNAVRIEQHDDGTLEVSPAVLPAAIATPPSPPAAPAVAIDMAKQAYANEPESTPVGNLDPMQREKSHGVDQ